MESGNSLIHQKVERDIPQAVRQAVLERDNAQCQVCGITGDNRLHLHHWKHFRSQGGGHDPWNLVTVCDRDHTRIHARLIDIMLIEVWPDTWCAFVRHRFGRHS